MLRAWEVYRSGMLKMAVVSGVISATVAVGVTYATIDARMTTLEHETQLVLQHVTDRVVAVGEKTSALEKSEDVGSMRVVKAMALALLGAGVVTEDMKPARHWYCNDLRCTRSMDDCSGGGVHCEGQRVAYCFGVVDHGPITGCFSSFDQCETVRRVGADRAGVRCQGVE